MANRNPMLSRPPRPDPRQALARAPNPATLRLAQVGNMDEEGAAIVGALEPEGSADYNVGDSFYSQLEDAVYELRRAGLDRAKIAEIVGMLTNQQFDLSGPEFDDLFDMADMDRSGEEGPVQYRPDTGITPPTRGRVLP